MSSDEEEIEEDIPESLAEDGSTSGPWEEEEGEGSDCHPILDLQAVDDHLTEESNALTSLEHQTHPPRQLTCVGEAVPEDDTGEVRVEGDRTPSPRTPAENSTSPSPSSPRSRSDDSNTARDRSVSEVTIPVPKLSILSLDSAQGVTALVKQFSSRPGSSLPTIPPERRDLYGSLQPGTPSAAPPPPGKEEVSGMVDYFTRQRSITSPEKHPREAAKKPTQLSPGMQASLDRVSACLSRSTSLDPEEESILRSTENLTALNTSPQRKTGTRPHPRRHQKENSPRHKATLTIEEAALSSKSSSLNRSRSDRTDGRRGPTRRKRDRAAKTPDPCDTEEDVDEIPEGEDDVVTICGLGGEEASEEGLEQERSVAQGSIQGIGQDVACLLVPAVDTRANGSATEPNSDQEDSLACTPADRTNKSAIKRDTLAGVNQEDSFLLSPGSEMDGNATESDREPVTEREDNSAVIPGSETDGSVANRSEYQASGNEDADGPFPALDSVSWGEIDLSDASEVPSEIHSKSPISAITERTEEPSQGSSSASLTQRHLVTVRGQCASLPPQPLQRESSQFRDVSDLPSMYTSLKGPEQPISSQPSMGATGSSSAKPKVKPQLSLSGHLRAGLRGERSPSSPTPPVSPTTRVPSEPLRVPLCRRTSRSLHNLSGRARCQGHDPKSRSLSTSTDNLGPGTPPARSPGARRGSGGGLSRRCVSVAALDDARACGSLARARSASLTSVAGTRRDYSQVPSRVRQYIKDMKEKDLRNSTRSLPCTPARRTPLHPPQGHTTPSALDETLLLRLAEDDDLPPDLERMREEILGVGGDRKLLREVLGLLVAERKLRHASDTTLATLQLRYDRLNTLFAEKQNELDRLRFYRVPETRNNTRGSSTVSSTQHSPSSTPRHCATPHTTPSYTPNPVKATSTPIADPTLNLTFDPSGIQSPWDDSAAGSVRSKGSCLRREGEGGGAAKDPPKDQDTLDAWLKDARSILRKVREFSVLEESATLQSSERDIIWNSILQEYWKVSSRFPLLTLLAPTHLSGPLLQEVGRAIQTAAATFNLRVVSGGGWGTTGRQGCVRSLTADFSAKSGCQESHSTSSVGKKGTTTAPKVTGGSKCITDPKLEASQGDAPVKTPGEASLGGSAAQPGSPKGREGTGNTALTVCSPAHSQESMKTVGPLEKVKLWQESLIDPSLPLPAYPASDTTPSPAPSLLSLGSSKPFPSPCPQPSPDTLPQQHTSQCPGEVCDEASEDRSPGRLECDLPKSSWRSSSATPRPPWGKLGHPRDVDSGCPGSEPSTRFSHNASLDAGDFTPAGPLPGDDVVLPQPPPEHPQPPQELPQELHTDASPSSDLITIAFPKSEKDSPFCERMRNRRSRTLSGSRQHSTADSSTSSSEGSKKKRHSQPAAQRKRPVSAEPASRVQHRHLPLTPPPSRSPRPVPRAAQEMPQAKQDRLRSPRAEQQETEQGDDHPAEHQTPQRHHQAEPGKRKNRHRAEQDQNSGNVTPLPRADKRNEWRPRQKLHPKDKYSAKYVETSDASDSNTSYSNSPSDVYNSISRLRRDFTILQERMLATAEDLQGKRKPGWRRDTPSPHNKSSSPRRRKPVRALNLSGHDTFPRGRSPSPKVSDSTLRSPQRNGSKRRSPSTPQKHKRHNSGLHYSTEESGPEEHHGCSPAVGRGRSPPLQNTTRHQESQCHEVAECQAVPPALPPPHSSLVVYIQNYRVGCGGKQQRPSSSPPCLSPTAPHHHHHDHHTSNRKRRRRRTGSHELADSLDAATCLARSVLKRSESVLASINSCLSGPSPPSPTLPAPTSLSPTAALDSSPGVGEAAKLE